MSTDGRFIAQSAVRPGGVRERPKLSELVYARCVMEVRPSRFLGGFFPTTKMPGDQHECESTENRNSRRHFETAKPHASFFHEADLPGALNAAELMKMKVLRTDTDERRAVAADLPQGRVFASGKAFVPFVAAPLYHRLVALARAADSICPSAADCRTWRP